MKAPRWLEAEDRLPLIVGLLIGAALGLGAFLGALWVL